MADALPLPTRGRYDILEAEFGAALGAVGAAYHERVTVYLAHLDCDGHPVPDMDRWTERAVTVLAGVGGGATAMDVRGAWLGDRQTPLHETTTVVYSFAAPESIAAAVGELRAFLTAYGRETNQGEVALSLENPDGAWFFRILPAQYGP